MPHSSAAPLLPARPLAGLWRDRCFWLALAAGPVAWMLLRMAHAGTGASVGRIPALLWPVLLYPILEEMAFRGAVQRWLLAHPLFRARGAGFTLANGLTSLLFAAVHLLRHSPAWALLVVPPSLIFGWFRDRYASILPGMVLHVFYNAGFFLLVQAPP